MYVICLSGTLAVFIPELERWEQPDVEEFLEYDAKAIEETFNGLLKGGIAVSPHMYIVLPSKSVPRVRIASKTNSWFLNRDASLGGEERNHWSELMLDLHLYLHLPKLWGMLVVSALGALLLGLIVSGLFAHRKIFRDAFKFRARASASLFQLDVHNRLSVWATPFYLMIAVTGAYFGLALPFFGVASQALFDGDNKKALEAVFGSEPELHQEIGELQLAKALDHLSQVAHDTIPILVTIHDAGKPGAYIELSSLHDQRLIYSENYLYDASGTFLRQAGFSNGKAGVQVLRSIYRLHFGYFGGALVKVAYGILGLALTVVSVTGINIWLLRRKTVTAINDIWLGFVWGVPIAILVSAITQITLGIPSVAIVWGVVLLSCGWSAYRKNVAACKTTMLCVLAISAVVLALGHIVKFQGNALHGFPALVNIGLLVAGFILAGYTHALKKRQQSASIGTGS